MYIGEVAHICVQNTLINIRNNPESIKLKAMEEKLNYLLEHHYSLFHADCISRALHDDSVGLPEFIKGIKDIRLSIREDIDEYNPFSECEKTLLPTMYNKTDVKEISDEEYMCVYRLASVLHPEPDSEERTNAIHGLIGAYINRECKIGVFNERNLIVADFYTIQEAEDYIKDNEPKNEMWYINLIEV